MYNHGDTKSPRPGVMGPLSQWPNFMAYFHGADPNSDPSSKVVDVFEKVGSAQAR